MNIGYIYILITLLFGVIHNYCSKETSKIFPETAGGQFKYISLSFAGSALCAGIYMLVSGDFSHITNSVLICSFISGIALAIAQLCFFIALQSGTMVINSVFATAGLIVPCIFGIFLFNESMSAVQWIGIAVFILSSYLLSSSAKEANSSFGFKTILLLTGSLLSTGATMVCQKAITFFDANANVSAFSFLSFLTPAIIFAIALLFAKKDGPKENFRPRMYPLLIIIAFSLFIINQLATVATAYVSSVVLFALSCGGKTILVAIMAAIVFKEKFTAKSLSGLIIGLISLFIINTF